MAAAHFRPEPPGRVWPRRLPRSMVPTVPRLLSGGGGRSREELGGGGGGGGLPCPARALPAPLAAAASVSVMELEVPEEAEGSAVAGAGAITPEAGAGGPDAAGGNVPRGAPPGGVPPGCAPSPPRSSSLWFLPAPPPGYNVGRSSCPPPPPPTPEWFRPPGDVGGGRYLRVLGLYPHTRTDPRGNGAPCCGARGGPRRRHRPRLRLSAAPWFVNALRIGFGCASAGPWGCPRPEPLRSAERCGRAAV